MYACTLCSKPFKQCPKLILLSVLRKIGTWNIAVRQQTGLARELCRVAPAALPRQNAPALIHLAFDVYDAASNRPGRRQLPKQNGAHETPLMDTRTPTSVSTNLDDGNTASLMANLDQLADNMIWDGQSNSTDFLLMDPSLAVSKTTQSSAPMVVNTPDFTFGLQSWGMDPPELLAALSAPPKVSPLADAGFLTRLPIDDPIAQRHATHLIQVLRAFPQMMVRRAVFPPLFIPTGTVEMGLKYGRHYPSLLMFASRTPDTRAFVWNTIRTEQRRLMDQTLCGRFRALCQGPFSLPEQTHPNRGWPDWIFAESRRRVACIWFLIGQVISTKTGIPCDTSEEYHCLPLPGGRSLWECRTNKGWEAEYSATQTTIPGWQLTYFGDLMEAQKANSDPSMIHKMDSWNAEADTMGFMLTLAIAMV
ncbi:hypothetical protein N7490_005726 [Penicillium lividum]|nr:hypothetical protein N7490_005726 [Penicillium lividum]